MKKTLINILCGAVMITSLTATLALGNILIHGISDKEEIHIATAEEMELNQNSNPEVDKPIAEREACIYVYYYRVYKGRLQRRKYNRTFGKWAESSWHDVK